MTDFFSEGVLGAQPEEDQESGEKFQGFVVSYIKESRTLTNLFKEGGLLSRDFVVIQALVSFYNPRTGLSTVTIKKLSEVIGLSYSLTCASIARLKRNLIVAVYLDRETGAKSLFLNPFMFVSGGASKRAFLQKRFTQLFNE
jgi:hypothetical protein